MRVELGKIAGDVVVQEDMILNGKISGSVTLAPGVTFLLNGLVGGDLTLQPGCRVELRGKVAGSVHNRGGDLTMFGMVGGSLTTEAGRTVLDTDAVVKGALSGPFLRQPLSK